ncbi:MAG: hypothetical protein ACREBC_35600 [Pyrinomonadaceae bacterium]
MSFEPLSSAYTELEAAARADGLWETLNVGLGDAEQDATINIAGNSFSSSLYPIVAISYRIGARIKIYRAGTYLHQDP